MGAELTSIKVNGVQKLFQGERVKKENGEIYWGRQAPILFPIVGKLKNNKTYIDGKEYFMNQHGFARDMNFKVIEKTNNLHRYVLEYNNDTIRKYPFKFKLYVEYLVKGNDLNVNYIVENIDNKEIVFGIGGHPAFCLDVSLNDYYIEFEENEEKATVLMLKDGLISDDKINLDDILEKRKILKLSKDTFLKDAIIFKNLSSTKVSLNSYSNGKILDFCFKDFPFLAFWSKVNAPFVCIEPWYTIADNYDNCEVNYCNKENMLHLKVGEKFNCGYTIKFN